MDDVVCGGERMENGNAGKHGKPDGVGFIKVSYLGSEVSDRCMAVTVYFINIGSKNRRNDHNLKFRCVPSAL